MHQFRTLCLLISSCCILFLSSCAVKTVKGYDEVPADIDIYKTTYFSNPETDYVYKAHIAIYGKDFGGIFIVKKIDETAHRVAFTTEFGNKLFDFTITDTDFTINYILEELDRKIIVNTLKKDFMFLLKNQYFISGKYENSEYSVYKSKYGKRYNYLFVNKQDMMLTKVVNATRNKEKVIIQYIPENDILAKKIVIDHKNIKLKIDLNYINNQ